MNRDRKKQQVVEAGLDHLLAAPIDMLRAALNASSLARKADIPKDTVYRLFRGSGGSNDAIVRAVSAAAAEPSWAGYEASLGIVAAAFGDLARRDLPFEEALIESMAANVSAQFQSPGGPVGWLLQAAALTASPVWKGPRHLTDDAAALARELLDHRLRFYRRMTEDLTQMMTAALSLLGRRPRPGSDVNKMIALMHALVDGAVLRLYLEPDVFTPRDVGEALLALALAFSEQGSDNDPRRPAATEGAAQFDRLIEEAALWWATERGDEATVAAIASGAGIDPQWAAAVCPTLADLADSVLWARVLGGGPLVEGAAGSNRERPGHGSDGELPMLFALLRRLREVVDELPRAARAASALGPDSGVRGEMCRQAEDVISRHCPGVDARTTARELVEAAFQGAAGWPTAAAFMRVLQPGST